MSEFLLRPVNVSSHPHNTDAAFKRSRKLQNFALGALKKEAVKEIFELKL